MGERVPSFFMLIPGPWREERELVRALKERGVVAKSGERGGAKAGEVRVKIVEDDELAEGFEWGRAGQLPDDSLARVDAFSRAALVECGQRLDEDPAGVAKLGRALRDAGGVAIRMEASGAASPWEPWLEQLGAGDAASLCASAVVMVQDDDDVMFTCGMHQFDLPDAQIAMSDTQQAIAWLDTFCVYQLDEQPGLASGHTFRPDQNAERRVFERWPDHRHHPNDGRHNPFGLWRFLAPGVSGVEATALVPTIVPPIVAMLHAAERSRGRSLTKPEVDEIVSKSTAIAMTPGDALRLERSRGYADIEPELAWEQWLIVRSTL